MAEKQTLRPKQLMQLLRAMIPAKLPVLITGAPGVGKTAIVAQACEAVGSKMIVSHPVVSDPTDYKGLPMVDKTGKSANWLPLGDLKKLVDAKVPTTFFLDDIGQAPSSVQASLMQLLLARHIGEHKVSEHVTFIAATNRRTDRAGVQGMLEPVKSRFNTIVELETTVPDWTEWAIESGQPEELIGFLNFRPKLLHQFEATAELTNSPCPRTWAKVGEMLQLGLSDVVELAAYQGAVGTGPAAEFMAFCRIYREMVSLDGIIMDPHNSPVPTDKPDVLYAIAVGLASKATQESFGNIAVYLDRMHKAGCGEQAALCLLSAQKREKKITHTSAFIKLATTSGLAGLIKSC